MTTNQPRRMDHPFVGEHDEHHNCGEAGCTPITGEAEGDIEAAVGRVTNELWGCLSVSSFKTVIRRELIAAARAEGPVQWRVTELEEAIATADRELSKGVAYGIVRAGLRTALSKTAEAGDGTS